MIITENKKTIILILIAFIFSFSMRLIWLYQFNGAEQFKFNNQFMINTMMDIIMPRVLEIL